MSSEEVVARGRGLLGVRFRPQGRSAGTGVDCIGLAGHACGLAMEGVRADYGMRSDDLGGIEAGFLANGFERVEPGGVAAGDVLVVRAGFSQLHVVVLTPGGFLHADAGLRRVVEVPGAVGWVVLSGWRSSGLPSPRSPAGESPSPAYGRGDR